MVANLKINKNLTKRKILKRAVWTNFFLFNWRFDEEKNFVLESLFEFIEKLSCLSDFRVLWELSSGYQGIYLVSYYLHFLLVLYKMSKKFQKNFLRF